MYYVCFRDDNCKFHRVFFLKQKSELCDMLEMFPNEVKTNGYVVKQFRCDGEKEFKTRVANTTY